jgi:type IV pilus assembly protein PilQ
MDRTRDKNWTNRSKIWGSQQKMNHTTNQSLSQNMMHSVKKFLFNAVFIVFWAAGMSVSLAQNAIEDLAVTKAAGGRTIVTMTLKEPPAGSPAAFSIVSPPRIAVDFAGTSNALGRTLQEVNEPVLRSLNVVQAGVRTRVVFNLTRLQSYETKVDGRVVTLSMFDAAGATQADSGAEVSRFAPKQTDAVSVTYGLRDVDFRRGRDGEGRIVVELSDSGSGFDIKNSGKTLIVDLLRTTVPRNLERKIDASDFGTPVVSVDTFQQGPNARLVIEPKGLWEHTAYQTDNRLIIEVRPLVEDPNKLTQGTRGGYKGDKLSLNFQDVAVRSVLQVIGDFTGLNIVVSDTVAGNLTLRLRDVPWDQALDLVMQTRGLDMRKNGNVVYIAPKEELATKEKLELESKQQITDLEPLKTELFQLNYQKAEAVQKMLMGSSSGGNTGSGIGGGGAASVGVSSGGGILSKRGSAVVDVRTNLLMVQDIPAKLDEVRRLLVRLDIPVKQVMIETRIVVADDRFSRQLGARFGQQTAQKIGNYSVGSSGQIGQIDNITKDGTVTFTSGATPIATGVPPWRQLVQTIPGTLGVNLPVANAAGQLALTFLNLGSGNMVNLELSAMEANNRGKVVSSPRLVTSDNKRAIIEQGTEIPYTTPGSGAAAIPAVAFKKAVLSLAVTPQITPDGKIIMELEIKKDSVGVQFQLQGGGSIPSIDTKALATQITVNNGETAVIGGIYEENTRGDVTKVPVLGDIPYIGALFRNTTKSENKSELLIFITPRIVSESLSSIK